MNTPIQAATTDPTTNPTTQAVPIPTKTCAKCHTTLPATTDHFYQDKRSTDYLNSYCILCTKAASHESYLRYKTRRDERRKYLKTRTPSTPVLEGFKICNVCKILKPATRSYFHKHATNRDGYYSTCKQCRNAMIRQSRSNPYQTPESFLKALATRGNQPSTNPNATPTSKATTPNLSIINEKLAAVFPG